MLPFAYYLLKVSLVSGLLYSYYLVALRNKKFHQYNRFYLLLTVLLSLIIPLVKINFLNYGKQPPNIIKILSAINYPEVYVKTATVKQSFLSDYNLLALYAFLLVSAVAFFILIFQFIKIFVIIRGNPKKVWNDVCFVFTESLGTPFSFFKYIFWDKNLNIHSDEGNQILQHELTHVKQHHSADKLFLNILLAAGWANPFFWIIRKELNMLHEFLADQKAITNGDTNAFAAMLLNASYTQHSFVLTNSFFHSPIRRRLLMITQSKNVSFSFFRRLMVLPLLALISILSAFKIEGKNIEQLQKLQKDDKKFTQTASAVENKNLNKDKYFEANNYAGNSDTTEAKFPGGNQAWKKYLETNLNANAPVKDRVPAGIYTVKVKFLVTETGDIKDVSAIQTSAHCPSCAIEAVRVIKSGPKWEPMTIEGRKATSQPVQFISFKVEEN